jgi:hypothetical protein
MGVSGRFYFAIKDEENQRLMVSWNSDKADPYGMTTKDSRRQSVRGEIFCLSPKVLVDKFFGAGLAS